MQPVNTTPSETVAQLEAIVRGWIIASQQQAAKYCPPPIFILVLLAMAIGAIAKHRSISSASMFLTLIPPTIPLVNWW